MSSNDNSSPMTVVINDTLENVKKYRYKDLKVGDEVPTTGLFTRGDGVVVFLKQGDTFPTYLDDTGVYRFLSPVPKSAYEDASAGKEK